MDTSFPTRITWLPIEGDSSAYAIAWEQELAKIYAVHPEWLTMLHAIDGRSLMSEDRWRAILTDHHPWKRRLGAKWR